MLRYELRYKLGRRMRKMGIPTETHTKFELGDTAADTVEEGGRATETEGGTQGGNYTLHTEEGVAETLAKTDKSDTEMDTKGGGEVGTSQSQSRHKKGQVTNIYLTDSDEEASNEQSKEGMSLGDVRQQSQAVHQSVQDLV